MPDHEELEGSVAAWVLGALEPAEDEAMRVHVEGCATCREVAGRLRRVVGALPLTADEATPPARLRSRILAAASSTARPAAAVPAVVRRPVQAALPRRAGLARRIPTYALAAVAAVALLLGVIIGQVGFRPTQPQQEQVARFTLAGHQEMAGARATVVDLRSDGLALVDFTGLPAAGPGRVYEVWLIPTSGNPVPAAVFVPDANGAKVVLVNRSLSGYTVMAVTNEAGPDGVAAPTQQPQLYGNVA